MFAVMPGTKFKDRSTRAPTGIPNGNAKIPVIAVVNALPHAIKKVATDQLLTPHTSAIRLDSSTPRSYRVRETFQDAEGARADSVDALHVGFKVLLQNSRSSAKAPESRYFCVRIEERFQVSEPSRLRNLFECKSSVVLGDPGYYQRTAECIERKVTSVPVQELTAWADGDHGRLTAYSRR